VIELKSDRKIFTLDNTFILEEGQESLCDFFRDESLGQTKALLNNIFELFFCSNSISAFNFENDGDLVLVDLVESNECFAVDCFSLLSIDTFEC
jgi:hypothetical protein